MNKSYKIIIYTSDNCSFCHAAKEIFNEKKLKFKEIQKEYYDADTGRAKPIGDRVEDQLDAPLHYAREGSYTQKAGQINLAIV